MWVKIYVDHSERESREDEIGMIIVISMKAKKKKKAEGKWVEEGLMKTGQRRTKDKKDERREARHFGCERERTKQV